MQSRFLTTILLALCVAHGVLSVPLELEPDAPASNDNERENEARINAAKDLANKNILKMEHVLDNPTEPGHQEMINAAFGKDPSLDMEKVKETVQNLKEGLPVKIKLETDPTPGVIAYTQFVGDKTPMTPTHVAFGDKYHSSDTSDEARAATLIHEATHAQSDTGDKIVKGKVLPGSDTRRSRTEMYSSAMEPYRTAEELNGDAKWSKLRDEGQTYWGERVPATKDMHKAAEAYGQFSSMCGAAVSDAAVGLRRRAMAAGKWDEAAVHLIRRQACSLPTGKKAAAKDGATSKTKNPEGKVAKASGDATAKKSMPPKAKSALTPKSKSDKAGSRIASAKFGKNSKAGGPTGKQRKAPIGKSALSRSKTRAGNNKSPLGRSKTGEKQKALPNSRSGKNKSLAKGGKAAGQGKASKSRPATLSKGRVPKSSKGLTGSKGSKPLSKGRANKGSAKGLTKGGTRAKKPSGSAKRPLSKTSSGKRPVSKKNGVNAKPKSSGKKIARPSAKSASKKNSSRPAAKKNVARPGSKKNAAKPNSKKNVGPPSKKASPKKNIGRPATSKKNVPRPASKKPVSLPANKNTGKSTMKAPAQRQAKQQAARPKSVPKAVPASKSTSKKGRRDLEFQF